MQEQEAIFEDYLRHKDLKFTPARRLILQAVFDLHEHFDIEYLYDIIHKLSSEVSRATVYRTIPLLVEAGLIQRSVRCETRDKFEHIYGHPRHAHWVCKVCGAVLESDLRELNEMMEREAGLLCFHADDISIVVQGKCQNCHAGDNDSH